MSVCGSPKISVCRPSLPLWPVKCVGFPGTGESDPSPGFSSCTVLPGLSAVALLKPFTTQERRLWQHKHFRTVFLSVGSCWPDVLTCPHGSHGNLVALQPPQSKSPTASVFPQVLAPLPESSETHRGQIFPPEQEHDYATYHEALPAARGGCQPGAELRNCSSLGRGEAQTS